MINRQWEHDIITLNPVGVTSLPHLHFDPALGLKRATKVPCAECERIGLPVDGYHHKLGETA